MPDKLLTDLNFIETLGTIGPVVTGAVGGAYAMYRLIRRNVREDVKVLAEEVEKVKADITECEGDHVYKDEFKQVVSLVRELHAHILDNPKHNKRKKDL